MNRKNSELGNPAIPGSLMDSLSIIKDPRVARKREHLLIDILVIGLCSMVTVGETFTDMETFGKYKFDWLKKFLELPNGIPSHDTFNRVFSSIDPALFLQCFVNWVQGMCPTLRGDTVAIDGKALRRSLNEGGSIPYIVSAWASDNGLVLGQVKVKDKSNEITAIPELLRILQLEGCVVTIDAMGCQKSITKDVITAKADYVLALKGNHATAHEEIRDYFDDIVPVGAGRGFKLPEDMAFYETVEKGHGRIETRRYWQTTDVQWFEDLALWTSLNSIGMVESVREIKGKKSTERRLFICSLKRDVKRFATAVRNHWGVENNVHWTLDVIFNEDQARARTKHGAENLAILRRIVLNLIKKDTSTKASMRSKRKIAALDGDFLKKLLGI